MACLGSHTCLWVNCLLADLGWSWLERPGQLGFAPRALILILRQAGLSGYVFLTVTAERVREEVETCKAF